MQIDPRTISREVPGFFYEIFPQLTPGIVAHFNARSTEVPVRVVSGELLESATVQHAMLFELAYSVAENLLVGGPINWESCIARTLERQRMFYDAPRTKRFGIADRNIAKCVGQNLAQWLEQFCRARGCRLVMEPAIPGFKWIGNGNGDFAVGDCLIEVKSTATRFSSADFRQVAMYWLLSYAAAIEENSTEWSEFVLFNPRSGALIQLDIEEFISIVGGRRTKVEILLRFQSMLQTRILQ